MDPPLRLRSLSQVSLTSSGHARGGGTRWWSLQGLPRSASSSEASSATLGPKVVHGAETLAIHSGSIHERRAAAYAARAFPLAAFAGAVLLTLLGAWRWPRLLLGMCGLFNVVLCAGMSLTGIYCIIGTRLVSAELRAEAAEGPAGVGLTGGKARETSLEPLPATAAMHAPAACSGGVVHLVVIPNYREEEEMLAQTLQSLAEAAGSERFHVVLAMEYREGSEGASKAQRLQDRFGRRFARFVVTSHPPDLEVVHADGSVDDEVPGKASNLKWALHRARALYDQDAATTSPDVLLTVADADVIVHPGYFAKVAAEYQALKEAGGSEHRWSMWQAPQLPFRNFGSAPLCSRLWAYVASTFEFGCVTSLRYGGTHLAFSTYSLPLALALQAQAHEADVIAEDHHAFLRCFFYSARAAALEGRAAGAEGHTAAWDAGGPRLRLRPVFLPVKATSVVSDEGCVQSWLDRWCQAKRHAQGVAELSYAVLATWDALRTLLPAGLLSFRIWFPMVNLIARLLYIHVVPACQFASMLVLSLYYVGHGCAVPVCADGETSALSSRDAALCALAGIWIPTWPVVIPTILIAVSNVFFLNVCFVAPLRTFRRGKGSLWHGENGGWHPSWFVVQASLAATVLVDLVILGGPVMVYYGVFSAILAFKSVLLRGNRVEYITAAKALGPPTKPSEARLLEAAGEAAAAAP